MAAMKSNAKELGAEYTAAMRDYLAGEGEAALRRAYEAGRHALADGLGVLEMVAAHQEAVLGAMRHTPGEQGKARALARAMSCFAESLSPYEMVLRGVQESHDRLQRSMRDLERAEEDIRVQNQKLAASQDALEKERQRHRALFDFTPMAMLATAMESTIREANGSAAALLGMSKDGLAGRRFLEFVAREDRARFEPELRRVELGTLDRLERLLFIEPFGEKAFLAAVTVQAERTLSCASLRWAIRDARESKRGEITAPRLAADPSKPRAALRSEFLAEASTVLAASFDVEANLAKVARLALPLLGEWCFAAVNDGHFRQIEVARAGDPAAAERLKQFRLLPHVPNEYESAPVVEQVTPEWCMQAAEDHAHAELLREFCGASAMTVPLRVRDRLLGFMTFVGASYCGEDITLAEDLGRRCALALESSRIHTRAITDRDKAEKASRAKDEFLAILSHELRNPLMPLIGWARMLRDQPLIAQDPLLAEGVRSMERNARTLERLVGDCLDLARISEGGIRMERKPVDLNQVTAASIASVKDMAVAKGLSLDPQLLSDSVLLLGDAVRLEQVMVNLLVNAVKYTDRGGSIFVRCARIGPDAEIEVKDTGSGIHPAFLEQIFEPFRRGSDSWLTNRAGLGLGLAIARRIVEMHGGRIWAESAGLDAGSTFRVRLPMAAAAVLDSSRELGAIREVEETGSLRVLVIEDSEDILFLLKIELEMAGHSVSTASDGKTGLAQAKNCRPDLIISDIKMPGVDGFALIREIRASEDLASTPAIALTGFGGKSDFDRAIAAGFDACVSKPAEPREISALIRKLTEKKRTAN
jgi:PAS domain S-box-containing protein